MRVTCIKEYGKSSARVGAVLHNIGIVHVRADNLNPAIDALEKAVRIRKHSLGSRHPKVAVSYIQSK